MAKSVFPEPHNHQIDIKKFEKYRARLKKKGKRFKPHASIETFDSKQVIKLLLKKTVVRLGVVQGVNAKGQRISMLAAFNSKGKMVGKALQIGDLCPPPKCE